MCFRIEIHMTRITGNIKIEAIRREELECQLGTRLPGNASSRGGPGCFVYSTKIILFFMDSVTMLDYFGDLIRHETKNVLERMISFLKIQSIYINKNELNDRFAAGIETFITINATNGKLQYLSVYDSQITSLCLKI